MLTYWLGITVKDKEISAPDDEAKELPKKRHLNVVFIGHVGRLIHFMAFLKDKMSGVRIYSLFWILIFDWPIDVAMVNAGWCVVQHRHPHCGCLDKILFVCLFVLGLVLVLWWPSYPGQSYAKA
jgi:hypothetical protein